MIVAGIGSVASAIGNVSGNAAANRAEALSNAATPAGVAEPTAQAQGAEGAEAATGLEGLSGAEAAEAAGAGAPAGGGAPNFGSALSEAVSSLEEGQQSAAAASQALATGTTSDPESAVTTVEDAALEMQLAAQIRTKATEAAQTIFQTQV